MKMTMIVYNAAKEVALTVEITAHAEVLSVLRRAYYEFGLITPDYTVIPIWH
jgi:hypothetical protein